MLAEDRQLVERGIRRRGRKTREEGPAVAFLHDRGRESRRRRSRDGSGSGGSIPTAEGHRGQGDRVCVKPLPRSRASAAAEGRDHRVVGGGTMGSVEHHEAQRPPGHSTPSQSYSRHEDQPCPPRRKRDRSRAFGRSPCTSAGNRRRDRRREERTRIAREDVTEHERRRRPFHLHELFDERSVRVLEARSAGRAVVREIERRPRPKSKGDGRTSSPASGMGPEPRDFAKVAARPVGAGARQTTVGTRKSEEDGEQGGATSTGLMHGETLRDSHVIQAHSAETFAVVGESRSRQDASVDVAKLGARRAMRSRPPRCARTRRRALRGHRGADRAPVCVAHSGGQSL